MKRSLLTALCVLACISLRAGELQEQEHCKKIVSHLLDKLAKDDQYAYRYQVSSAFPDSTKGQINGDVFKSVSLGVLYTASNNDINLKCKQGGLFVRSAEKQVLWHPFASDSEYHRAVDFMSNTGDALKILDSLFIRNAQLKEVGKDGENIKVTFEYPDGSPIQSADFVFGPDTLSISAISYDVKRPIPGYRSDGAAGFVHQRVVMSDFRTAMPGHVKRLIKGPFTEQRIKSLYKNFTVKKF